MANPLHGLDVSAAFWMIARERSAELNKRRPRGVTYCVWCDREFRTGATSSGASSSHQNSRRHIDNVLAIVEREKTARAAKGEPAS